MPFTIRAQMLRAVAVVIFGFVPCTPAAAALTCEQLLATAQAAVRFRDQGHSLDQVLAGLKGIDAEHKLTPAEVDVLRKAVAIAFLSQASPEEIALECTQARGQKKP